MMTTQQWQFGEDFSVVSNAAQRDESNDRVRSIAYIFDNSTNPWTGSVNLSLDYASAGSSQSFRVAFYGFNAAQSGIYRASSSRNDNALTQINNEGKARTAAGTNEVFLGPDWDGANFYLESSASRNVSTGSITTFSNFSDTIDLGQVAYDRIAMIVWTEGRGTSAFTNFSLSVIPEPSVIALAVGGIGTLFLLRRRHPRS